MNKLKRYSATMLFLLVSVFSGNSFASAFMVGGKCIYQETFAPFEITATDEGLKGHFIGIKSAGQFDLKHELKPSIYPAIYSQITEGSCIPKKFLILSTEQFSRPFLITLTNGQINDKVRKNITDLAVTFKAVKEVWPQAHLQLCGMPDTKYSEEYRFGLKSRYEQQVSNLLVSSGVEEQSITYEKAEECATEMNVFTNDEDGVWVKFMLFE